MQMYEIFDFLLTLDVVLSLCFLILAQHTEGAVYYCDDGNNVKIPGNSSGTIRTVKEGKRNYVNNMHCRWTVKAANANQRIQITVRKVDLQWAPETAICQGYDHVEIRDGGPDGLMLSVFCGNKNPHSIISNTSSLLVTFKSDDRTMFTYTGVAMDFGVFSIAPPAGGCPHGWVSGPSPSTGPYCYSLKVHEETWLNAQTYCANDLSNLVSFESDEEADFVTEYILNHTSSSSSELVWIGLNDIAVTGQYQWIDLVSRNSTQSRWHGSPHTNNEYLNCVALRVSDGLWQEADCGEAAQSLVKYKFVCKRKRVGYTQIHLVPEERIEKGEEGKLPAKKLIILGAVVAFLMFLVVIYVCVRLCTHKSIIPKCKRSQTQEEEMGPVRPPEADWLMEGTRPLPSAPPYDGDGSLQMEPPPTYEESEAARRKQTT